VASIVVTESQKHVIKIWKCFQLFIANGREQFPLQTKMAGHYDYPAIKSLNILVDVEESSE
jgi:hypothetical protein